jgi:hypothetical protein
MEEKKVLTARKKCFLLALHSLAGSKCAQHKIQNWFAEHSTISQNEKL